MTANDIEPVNNMRRVSSGNRATERNDSIQEKPKPSSSAKPRRPSLIEAMRRASLVIGDGVCESWKELRMLGILPEPETEDDDAGPGADVNATDLAREENTRESVDATDSDSDESVRTVIGPTERDFAAEHQEQQILQESLGRFSFDNPTDHLHDSERYRRNLAGFDSLTPYNRRIIRACTYGDPRSAEEIAQAERLRFRAERAMQQAVEAKQLKDSTDMEKKRVKRREVEKRVYPHYQWWTTEPEEFGFDKQPARRFVPLHAKPQEPRGMASIGMQRRGYRQFY